MLKISKYYPSVNNHHQSKRQCELISLITEPFALDHHEQSSSVPIKNNEVDEQEKSETTNNQVCRICYSTGDLQSLINPCQCSGTMGILHRNCLERWLEISNTTKCEICQHQFEVIRHPKSLVYFLTNPLRSSDIRYLINDFILFVFLTTIIGWLSIVNLSKIRATKTVYDGSCYLILPICVIFIYILWCWISFRYHIQVIKEWRSVNQFIRVINRKPQAKQSDCSHISINPNEEENIFPDIHIL